MELHGYGGWISPSPPVNTTSFCYLFSSILVPLDVACRQSVGNLPKCHWLISALLMLILDFVQNLNRSCPETSFKPESQTPTTPPPGNAAEHQGSGINHCSSQTFEISGESCLTLDMRRCLGVAEMVPHPLVISS